nr:hypothetical protein [Blautia argi]
MNKVKQFFYSQKAAPYVFILPFVITILLFWLFPIGNGVLLSFQDVLKDKWVGFDNYSRLLTDKMFFKAVYNSLKYMVGTLILFDSLPSVFCQPVKQ